VSKSNEFIRRMRTQKLLVINKILKERSNVEICYYITTAITTISLIFVIESQ